MTRSDIVDEVLAAYYSGYPRTHSEKLYTCKAIIVHVDDSDWLVLRSYATVVAAFQFSTDILWVLTFIPTQLRSTLPSLEIGFATNIITAGIIRAR